MKVSQLLTKSLKGREGAQLKRKIIESNLSRGRLFALIVLVFEAVLLIVDIGAAIIEVDNRFAYINYVILYALMLLSSLSFRLLTGKLATIDSQEKEKKADAIILVYVTFIMCWGSVVSLLDQRLYGQVMVFMVNMIACSVIYYLDNNKIWVPYAGSLSILYVGLPFFQPSSDILIGHYINITMFAIISFVASRILYSSFYKDFKSNLLLAESNALLKKEIMRNNATNSKLVSANRRLKEITMVDELTGIPNRRRFNNYIDFAFDYCAREKMLLSIIMIDIDHFKSFNDKFGHIEGDQALIRVAKAIYAEHRSSIDFVARMGGEEFLFAAFNTDENEIRMIAERIRQSVLDLRIPQSPSGSGQWLSISMGTCTRFVQDKSDVNYLIRLADEAMYRAKATGRNRVEGSRLEAEAMKQSHK